jgi:hypothetical protein
MLAREGYAVDEYNEMMTEVIESVMPSIVEKFAFHAHDIPTRPVVFIIPTEDAFLTVVESADDPRFAVDARVSAFLAASPPPGMIHLMVFMMNEGDDTIEGWMADPRIAAPQVRGHN